MKDSREHEMITAYQFVPHRDAGCHRSVRYRPPRKTTPKK